MTMRQWFSGGAAALALLVVAPADAAAPPKLDPGKLPGKLPAVDVPLGPPITTANLPKQPGPPAIELPPPWTFDDALQLTGWTRSGTFAGARIVCPGSGGRTSESIKLPQGKPARLGGDYWIVPWNDAQGCWLESGAGKGTATTPELVVSGRYLHLQLAGNHMTRVEVHVKLPNGKFLKTSTVAGDGSGQLKSVVIDLVEAGVAEPVAGKRIKLVLVDDSDQTAMRLDGLAFSAGAKPTAPSPPLFGFVDLHTHPFQQIAFGGDMFHGRIHSAIDEMGNVKAGERSRIDVALKSCYESHGTAPNLQGTLIAIPGMEDGHDGRGNPEFIGWPHWRTLIHQQMYVDWLRRAWEGGLRIVHVDVTTSHLLAGIYELAHAELLHDKTPNPTTDDWNLRKQLEVAHAFVQLPDVKEFAAIARSPAEAREIVASGKLALVLGAELDDFGEFRKTLVGMPEDKMRDTIRKYIHELYTKHDLRHVFPVHLADNAFGGTAIYNLMFLLGSVFETGESPRFRNAFADGVRLRVDQLFADSELIDFVTRHVPGLKDVRQKIFARLPLSGTAAIGHANELGLTRAGEILVEELMRAGMIVDIDHMSDRAAERTLQIARRYTMPVVSSHTGFRELSPGAWVYVKNPQNGVLEPKPNTDIGYSAASRDKLGVHGGEWLASERSRSAAQLRQVTALGGMVGVGTGAISSPVSWGPGDGPPRTLADCDGTTKAFAQHYLFAVEQMGGRGIALGTDFNGLAGALGPRFGTQACVTAAKDDIRKTFLPAQVAAQRNPVRYANPTAHNIGRFIPGPDDPTSALEAAAWGGVEKFVAGRGGELGPNKGGLERDAARIAHGLYLAKAGKPAPGGDLLDKKDDVRAAHEVWNDVKAGRPSTGALQVVIRGAWDRYHAIVGTNPPLQKSKSGSTDFDFNLDGLAHVGLLPDMLQDVRNIGLTPADLAPLFRGAEDYVRMWERIEAQKAALVQAFP
jgi:hypothetical protein